MKQNKTKKIANINSLTNQSALRGETLYGSCWSVFVRCFLSTVLRNPVLCLNCFSCCFSSGAVSGWRGPVVSWPHCSGFYLDSACLRWCCQFTNSGGQWFTLGFADCLCHWDCCFCCCYSDVTYTLNSDIRSALGVSQFLYVSGVRVLFVKVRALHRAHI